MSGDALQNNLAKVSILGLWNTNAKQEDVRTCQAFEFVMRMETARI